MRSVRPDIGDTVPADRHITHERLSAAAVVDRPTGNQHIVTGVALCRGECARDGKSRYEENDRPPGGAGLHHAGSLGAAVRRLLPILRASVSLTAPLHVSSMTQPDSGEVRLQSGSARA